jgi:hypothetical protein
MMGEIPFVPPNLFQLLLIRKFHFVNKARIDMIHFMSKYLKTYLRHIQQKKIHPSHHDPLEE